MIMEEYSTISFHPIGVIHSPFKERKGMPIQPKVAKNIKIKNPIIEKEILKFFVKTTKN